MTKNVKSNRLHARGWLAALALGCVSLAASAADVPIPKPPNGAVSNPNYLEYKKTGNTYTWNPVVTTTPPGSGTVSFPSSSTVSDVTPKMTTTGDLPYQHKGGAGAKVTITTPIDKSKLAKSVSDTMKGAAAGAAVSGNPYVAAGALALGIFGEPLARMLVDWGVDQFKNNGDGDVTVLVPDPSSIPVISDGYFWKSDYHPDLFLEPNQGCIALTPSGYFFGYGFYWDSKKDLYACRYSSTPGGLASSQLVSLKRRQASNCPSGSVINNGVCNGPAPKLEKPINDFFQEKIVNQPWNADFASIAAATIAMGILRSGNLFTDDASIAGPASVPISETVGTWPVNVLPGTTTPAPAGHTGPTDSGTQTTTTTTTATNTFNPSSPGSAGTGPSMTTSQKTETKTSVTNNITNNTSTSVTTNITQTDEAPKDPEKDFCEKNPDSLACAEADTPEQDVPRDKINITYEYADLFGNGACPADSYLNTHGQSLKVWDWQNTCQNVQDYFRPILIACCAFAAFVIISAGVKE